MCLLDDFEGKYLPYTYLWRNPSESSLNEVLNLPAFEALFERVTNYKKESEEEYIQCHVSYWQSENVTLKNTCKLNVKRYHLLSHWITQITRDIAAFRTLCLNNLKQTMHPAFTDLKEREMGASISDQPFSSIHGDLVTELFNKETKGTSGPFRSGFSTNIETVNTWVNTIHIHEMLRVALRKHPKLRYPHSINNQPAVVRSCIWNTSQTWSQDYAYTASTRFLLDLQDALQLEKRLKVAL